MANGHSALATSPAPAAPPAVASTVAQLLTLAIERNLDLDKLKELTDLYQRLEEMQALKAYNLAMRAFKADVPTVEKNAHVSFPHKNGEGTTEYDYATLDNLCTVVIPVLSQHGLSHRWKTEQLAGGLIRVTCILSHESGHVAECASLSGPPDTSGTKNQIQAIASTVFYLERYTLFASLGMAAAGCDDDGRGGAATIEAQHSTVILPPAEQGQCAKLAAARTRDELRSLFKAAYSEASKAHDSRAQKALIAAKDRRLRELGGAR